MFSLPIIIGIMLPYASHFFPLSKDIPVWWYLISDMIFVSSFFVLGGDFWDKLSGLFKYRVKVVNKDAG
jgi:hypothetical protein